MPKIDVMRPITNLNGFNLKNPDKSDALVCDVLSGQISVLPTDKGIPVNERRRRFALSVKIAQATGPIDIDDGDVKMATDIINESTLPPLYSEQIIAALEGRPNPVLPPERPKPALVVDAAAFLSGGAPGGIPSDDPNAKAAANDAA